MAIQDRIEPANRIAEGGTDQQVINLLLWPQTKKIPDKLVCFWGCGELVNDIVSVTRGWVGGEVPVALHYSRWYAPWIVKTPKMDAYGIWRLGKVCHELYQENLAAFESAFK